MKTLPISHSNNLAVTFPLCELFSGALLRLLNKVLWPCFSFSVTSGKRAGTLRGCLASSLLDCQDFYLTLQKSLSSIMVFFLEFWCVRCWCHVGIFTSRLGSEPQSQHAFYGTQSLYSNSFSSLLLHIPSLSPLLLLLPFLSQLVTGTHSENTAFSTPAPQVCKRKIAHLSSSEAVGPFSWIIEWLPDW